MERHKRQNLRDAKEKTTEFSAIVGTGEPLPAYRPTFPLWKQAIGALFGLAFLIVCAAFLALFIAQERSHDLIVSGRKAYRAGDYVLAEERLSEAYRELKPFPFHTYFGPCCYRLAKTYEAQEKWTQAELLFQQAVEHCNWASSEASIDWAPAVFRSYCHLAQIAAKRGYITSACIYYECAEAVVSKETNAREVEQARDHYMALLDRTGKLDREKLAQIKSTWRTGVARYAAFSER